ncbi:hypothetical protein B484DRAFT_459831 [Ochromonadaceae sp. CCMP2298]|nr:hypothetical protein B484DRAFT_459831 [Ochromonadaceae sp. CCMP2298]
MSSYSTGVRRPRSLTMTLLLLGGGCERMCFLGRVQGLARTAPAGMKLREDGATQRKKIFAGKPLLDPALNANLVLSRCPDFASEVSALQELLESRGHILIVCVKCHPELAGCGIEYSCWNAWNALWRRP